ncbi:MAG: FAD-dependent oxidoreductase [SAR202 cluster bacterium]|nr:FAD-dependent oxidoreductase [SAR202 cluster bacterium]
MRIGILGCGSFGLAAAIELRLRGHAVTALDQGVVPNPRATSTDVSKAIRRTMYGDHHSYVELVEQAGQGWRRWEERWREKVYHQTGMLNIFRSFGPGTPRLRELALPE